MTMQNDLISRSALIAEYDRVHVGTPGGARKLMEDAPAVDAEPVRHGHWENKETALGNKYTVCSACNTACVQREENGNLLNVDMSIAKYCPACGAKMDLEVSE